MRLSRQMAGLVILVIAFVGVYGLAGAAGRPRRGSLNYYLPLMPKMESVLTELRLEPAVTGFGAETPVAITHAGDDRLFVATQIGRIYVILAASQAGEVLKATEAVEAIEAAVFLDLSAEVNFSFEEGLLGLAFHPDYQSNGYFYVTYTQNDEGRIVLARYQVNSNDPNLADPGSRLILFEVEKPLNAVPEPEYSPVHNAGDLHFGHDGYLVVALGDGGPDPYLTFLKPSDPNNNGQRVNGLLGKLLRLDVDSLGGVAPDCGSTGYRIPASNPFVGDPEDKCDEIWSYGWRNPWRFSFDRRTGDMFITDVGEWEWEEVNFEGSGAAGGRNYGWRCFEGTFDHRNATHVVGSCSADSSIYTFPLHQYTAHGDNCAIIGGFVYRGSQYPTLYSHYLYTDNCSRTIWAIDADNRTAPPIEVPYTLSGSIQTPAWTTFGEDVNGELYMGGYLYPNIYHITVP